MDIIFVLLLVVLLSSFLINTCENNFDLHSKGYLWVLFGMHVLLTIGYMLYTANSSSDSVSYFVRSSKAEDWGELWGTGTTFIKFFAWPFTHFIGLSYFATMILFSFFGFVALLLFYICTRENVVLTKSVWGTYTMTEIVFLLPNKHFWSSSLGKGSTILLGLALFTFGLSRFNRRILFLIIGGGLTYMVRPHIFLTLVLSTMMGLLFTSSGLKWYFRWAIFIGAAVLFYVVSDKVVEVSETESLNVFSSNTFTHRVQELSKADSGVDISNYNIIMKLFTFWFRPLFIDSPGLIGFISSFENLFYIFMLYSIIKESIGHWNEWNGWFRICLFIFLFGSLILAQITGNLGIAMRQKAQLMPFFFILYCKSLTFREKYDDD